MKLLEFRGSKKTLCWVAGKKCSRVGKLWQAGRAHNRQWRIADHVITSGANHLHRFEFEAVQEWGISSLEFTCSRGGLGYSIHTGGSFLTPLFTFQRENRRLLHQDRRKPSISINFYKGK